MKTPYEQENVEIDEANTRELARHGVSTWSAKDVVDDPVVWVPNKKFRSGAWKAVGFDRGGRALTIICDYDPIRRSLRPITGWDATASDWSKYLGGGTSA